MVRRLFSYAYEFRMRTNFLRVRISYVRRHTWAYEKRRRTIVITDHRHLRTIVQGRIHLRYSHVRGIQRAGIHFSYHGDLRSIGRLIDWFDRFDQFDIRKSAKK